MAINEINDKYYGYNPKNKKSSKNQGQIYSGAEKSTRKGQVTHGTYENIGNRLDRVNPYEFRKGMDIELAEMGISRLRESTPEEREKATEAVLKNLETKHSAYYSALLQFETGMNQGSKINETSFNKFLETFSKGHGDGMLSVEKTTKELKMVNDQMEEPKYDSKEYKKPFITSPSPLKESKMKQLESTIKNEIKRVLKEQSAKQAAMADMEDEGEVEKSSKKKTTSKKDKPLRKDRFDREEEAIKDILFRVDAKGKKPKEEGDYTKDNPAEGSMLFAKDEMLAKYKEIKTKEDDPKKTLEEYNKLLTEKNEEFKDAIEKFVEEFEKNGITMSDIYGEKLSDTIKNLQERLKLGINKARAGVEEEARGMRREVALTEMTRDQHLRLLEIVKENGISLREGTDHVKVYYEIAKAAYLEGLANGLKI